MAFDPAAKAARYQRKLDRQRMKKRVSTPKIPAITQIPQAETSLALVTPPPMNIIEGETISSTNPQSTVQTARELLQHDARFYVRAHKRAIKLALAAGDHDVARKGAAEMIKAISDGRTRIVDVPEADRHANAPVFQIGIALGGMPSNTSTPQKRITSNSVTNA